MPKEREEKQEREEKRQERERLHTAQKNEVRETLFQKKKKKKTEVRRKK